MATLEEYILTTLVLRLVVICIPFQFTTITVTDVPLEILQDFSNNGSLIWDTCRQKQASHFKPATADYAAEMTNVTGRFY